MSPTAPVPLPACAVVAAAADSARAALLAQNGVDRLVAYHSSVYRTAGLPSIAGLLPWASANEQTLGMMRAVVEGAGGIPVLATVMASDPFRTVERMLDACEAAGVVGVLNAPTTGLVTGALREELERRGLGYGCELELVGAARARGLEAMTYVFDIATARSALVAGATALVLHLGITGSSGVDPVPLVSSVAAVAPAVLSATDGPITFVLSESMMHECGLPM